MRPSELRRAEKIGKRARVIVLSGISARAMRVENSIQEVEAQMEG